MRFTERMVHLLKADAHGVVDSLEDRRLVLRQALREAELEIDRKRARLEALGSELEQHGAELERLEAKRDALDADVALAVAQGEDDLARFSIRRLLPVRQAIAEVSGSRDAAEQERAKLGERLEEQERQLAELESRVRARLRCRDESSADELSQGGSPVAEEEIELELLRRKGGEASRRDGRPGASRGGGRRGSGADGGAS